MSLLTCICNFDRSMDAIAGINVSYAQCGSRLIIYFDMTIAIHRPNLSIARVHDMAVEFYIASHGIERVYIQNVFLCVIEHGYLGDIGFQLTVDGQSTDLLACIRGIVGFENRYFRFNALGNDNSPCRQSALNNTVNVQVLSADKNVVTS